MSVIHVQRTGLCNFLTQSSLYRVKIIMSYSIMYNIRISLHLYKERGRNGVES